MTFGFSRYRLAAEIPLVVLAATGVDWGLRALAARRQLSPMQRRAASA